MKKCLFVVTLLAVACGLAAAQAPGSYSFWSASGTEQYCNFNVITLNSGGVVAGYDNITAACGLAINSPIVGFDVSVANDGPAAHGKGVVVGDGIYDAEYEAFSGLQWTVFQSAKLSKEKNGRFSGAYGWEGVAGSYTGTYFGDNYGFLTAGAPSAKGLAANGATTGRIAKNFRVSK